jgi:tRNA (guanine37-N1)-methyltransferase
MKPEPLAACIEGAKKFNPEATVLLTTPQGKPLKQKLAQELSYKSGLLIICGRYEGVDERIRERYVDMEISVGDFVLSGGELAAMVILDTVTRLIPGVLGSDESATSDSFSNGILEYPQYTRPPEFNGMKVPEVLLSGNHSEIARWRREQSLIRTAENRPDLLKQADITDKELLFLHSTGVYDV